MFKLLHLYCISFILIIQFYTISQLDRKCIKFNKTIIYLVETVTSSKYRARYMCD